MKTMMTAALLFATMLNMAAQTQESNLTSNAQAPTEPATAACHYEKVQDTLSVKLKHLYDYDQQHRMLRHEVQKWNRHKQQWKNQRCWTYDYTDGKMTVELAIWDKRRQEYGPARDKVVYDPLCYLVLSVTNYKWNKKCHDLQLANNYLIVMKDDSLLQSKAK